MQKFRTNFIVLVSLYLTTKALAADGGSTTASNAHVSEPEAPAEGEELSLGDILALKSSVAVKRELTSRETPGILSIITHEEIMNSGVRNLQEALTLFIPGMSFGPDLEGVNALGYRGFYATDGKVLLLIDGVDVNDEFFGNAYFGAWYPVDIIDKIEVVRGPGSPIYGGFAGVAVISVKTRTDGIEGIYAAGSYARMKTTYASQDLTLGVGKKGAGYQFNGLVSFAAGQGTDSNVTDLLGNTVNFKDQQVQRPTFADLHANVGSWDLRLVADKVPTKEIVFDGPNFQNAPLDEAFNTYLAQVTYTYKPSSTVSVVPKLTYKYTATNQAQIPDIQYAFYKSATRWTPNVGVSWDVRPGVNLYAGAEDSYFTISRSPDPNDTFKNYNDRDFYSLNNTAAFAQLGWDTSLANLTLGARYDFSSQYGTSLSPRAAAVKVIDQFHAKAMVSQSFRAPGGMVPDRVLPGTDVKNEKGVNLEVEMGYQLSKNMFIQANAYNIRFRDLLAYVVATDGSGIGGYSSGGILENRGVEVEYRFQERNFSLLANYSFSHQVVTDSANFLVPGHDGYALGMPSQRANLVGTIPLTSNFSISPSLNYYGVRYYVGSLDGDGNPVYSSYDPQILAHLNFRYKKLFLDDLELDFGVQNLFDTDFKYTSPYLSYIAPMPAATRTYSLLLAYSKRL